MLESIPFNTCFVTVCKKVCVLAKYSYVNDYKCGHKYALKYNSIEISSQIGCVFFKELLQVFAPDKHILINLKHFLIIKQNKEVEKGSTF